ncbi:MAG: MaoC family dehydratase N-terminal domain-containing protein [Rhizobiaceae bacterium]|nr:MaoC family dehydratase N-terminal domain-containing protein [Rhizobiaceae bacterium]
MGKTYAELEIGDRFITPGRTITEGDVFLFAGLTGDYNPIHTNRTFAEVTDFGECIAHGSLGIGVAFGLLSRIDLIDGTVIALLGLKWNFHAPVRFGDTVHVVAEVTNKRPVKHEDRGIVELDLKIPNQEGVLTHSGSATVLLRRERPAAAGWGKAAKSSAA